MSCRRYLVTGRVQGVFYRASAQETAERLGVVGWVRNCKDGSVELLACGSEELLSVLEQWLWQGPQLAQVTDVQTEDIESGGEHEFAGFGIRY